MVVGWSMSIAVVVDWACVSNLSIPFIATADKGVVVPFVCVSIFIFPLCSLASAFAALVMFSMIPEEGSASR